MKVFLVGGAVRDKIMGKTPNDFDFSVVMTNGDHCDMAEMNRGPNGTKLIGPKVDFFTFMIHRLRKEGFRTFVITPEHLTVRAQFPVGSGGFLDGMTNITGGAIKPGKKRLTADFVLARKEGAYSDGRRPDSVSPGTLEDDLARRDFTMNAIAQDEDGNFIDPFGGQQDIADGRIRAVGNAKDRMMEDSLRVLRALRFRVQLGFRMDSDLAMTMVDVDVLDALKNVSDERKMDELNKMFRSSTINSLMALERFSALRDVVFAGKVNLMATMKEKGFK